MANFGTPTVIGTLTSGTAGTSYVVPITGSSAANDGIVVLAGASQGGTNVVTSVSDTQGNTYVEVISNVTNQDISFWQSFASKPLSSSDTITVTYANNNSNVKNVFVLDCPGVTTFPGGIDQANNNFGVSGHPSVTVPQLTEGYELAIVLLQNNVAGGTPGSFTGGFNIIQTIQSGSGAYMTVGYQIVTTSAALSFGATITSASFGALLVTMLPNIQSEFVQQPFPLGQLPPSLVMNPVVNSLRPPSISPPFVLPTPPVSISGAQSNVFTPGVNFLTGDNQNFNGGKGNWTSTGSNTNVPTQTNTLSHNAAGAISMVAIAAGTTAVASCNANNIKTQGLPVSGGDSIFVAAWMLAVTATRSCQIGCAWYDINGTLISSSFGTSATNSVTTWTLITGIVTAPSNAAFARVAVQVLSNGGASETHWLSDVWFFDITSGSGMSGGFLIYQNMNQQFQLSPVNLLYPLSISTSTLQYSPRQSQAIPFAAFEAGPAAGINVTAPAGIVSVSQTFAPQYPFLALMPLFMQITPTLSWHLPNYNTGNLFVNIDGGTGGQVAVKAQFPDQAVTVSVSAVGNVAVTAPVTQFGVPGVKANVNVVANSGSIAETLAGATSTVNVVAVSGVTTDNRTGVAANVSVVSPAGVVTVSQSIAAANVTVSMAGDNVVVVQTGITGHVTVASSGVAVVTPSPSPANVNVVAQAGTINRAMTGVVATASVASNGSTVNAQSAGAVNINVTAFAGALVKTPSIIGTAANITVSSIANPTLAIPGPATGISVAARAGTNTTVNIPGIAAKVTVTGYAGQDGVITISGSLVNPDLAEDLLLSDQGKLLDIRVRNILVSADEPLMSQGI